MGFGLAKFIPAVSIKGEDEYLIVGIDGLDAIVIDQDGDMRPVTMTDLRTKWVYLADVEVWWSNQTEIEDLIADKEEKENAQEAT